jgi:hypothetical protein
MCGRVVAASSREVLAGRRLGAGEVVGDELPPRWNVAPGSQVCAVAGTGSGRPAGAPPAP